MATKKREWDESGYRPLDSSGNDYASLIGISDIDRAALDAATNSFYEHQAAGDQVGMDAAHKQAEAIRSKYNYSGGADGSQYLPMQTTPAYERGEFSYESAPTYANKYETQINDLANQILNREAFSYDHTTDPLYSAYKKEYTREGQRAAADTLGQMAAMTGGQASTAAISASQQAGNYYAAQMADKIPELQQLAYSMYQAEGDTQRANLDMLNALEQGDYAKYLNLLSQYNTDREFAYNQYENDEAYKYNQWRDNVSDSQYNQQYQYQLDRDAIEDAWYEQQYADSRADAEFEKNLALQEYALSVQKANASGADPIGPEEDTDDVYTTLRNAGVKTEGAAYAALIQMGYSSTEATKLAQYYMAEGTEEVTEDRVSDENHVSIVNGEEAIFVAGLGFVPWDRLADLVDSGDVLETVENGVHTYTFKRN